MKNLIEKFLATVAKKILNKYQPQIIGVTGSVGKTSTKEAIYTVLRAKFGPQVARSLKNYNNEIGLPLAVIGEYSAGDSVIRWLWILFRGLRIWLLGSSASFPKILILEMGADKVGDIAYLLKIAPCQIGVLTAIGPSHLEHFGTIENIAKEKGQILMKLPKTGLAVLNIDDKLVAGFKTRTPASVLSYGLHDGADVRASDVVISEIEDESPELERVERIRGISFKATYNGSTVPFHLPGVLGTQHIYAALAGVAVGLHYGMNLLEISDALKEYHPEPGRMALIKGIKGTLIIDDTYNSSPASSMAALDIVSLVLLESPRKKWAILGDMLELGSYSEEGHLSVGRKAFEAGVDFLVVVGEKARDIARGARQAGMNQNNIFEFSDRSEAGVFVQGRMRKGDLLLVKGSQGMRMEMIVRELMAEPLSAPTLLTRQDALWLKK